MFIAWVLKPTMSLLLSSSSSPDKMAQPEGSHPNTPHLLGLWEQHSFLCKTMASQLLWRDTRLRYCVTTLILHFVKPHETLKKKYYEIQSSKSIKNPLIWPFTYLFFFLLQSSNGGPQCPMLVQKYLVLFSCIGFSPDSILCSFSEGQVCPWLMLRQNHNNSIRILLVWLLEWSTAMALLTCSF